MSRRRHALWGLLILVVLAGCELATPPPLPTPRVEPTITPSPAPTVLTVEWPSERLVFPYLEKIWLIEDAPPYALTIGRSPVLSPDGNRVAYLLPDSEMADLSQVYVLDLRTDQIYLVSGPPAAYGPPAWSPDSRFVAYTSGPVLVLSDARGEVQRPIATDVGIVGEGAIAPAWTADGEVIVCPLTRLGSPDLFAIQVDDGEAVRVSYTGGFPAGAPFVVLSEDTEVGLRDTVLYTNLEDGGTLWLSGIDGAGRRRVLPQLSDISGLMLLSPDGRKVAGLRQLSGERGYLLWVVDLTTETMYEGGTLAALPDILRWTEDSRTIHWITEAMVHRYTLASGKGVAVAELPAPTPTPTATPLPVTDRLVYYRDGSFYLVKPYVVEEPQKKDLSISLLVPGGFSMHEGTVAFPREADIYTLALEGGTPQRLYTFQQAGLQSIEVIYSLQGNALLYAATYEEEEYTTTFGLRVDLGVIQVRPARLRRFAFLTDRQGASPLFYDETSGQAVFLPRGADSSFISLEVYDVGSGQLSRLLPVEGESPVAGRAAAVISPDLQWAVAAGYDAAAGRGFLRTYRLTTTETISQTFFLPEGTYTWGPLRWSKDGQYVSFIPILGAPDGRGEQVAQGIWVLQPATLEARQVVTLEDPQIYLVGWR